MTPNAVRYELEVFCENAFIESIITQTINTIVAILFFIVFTICICYFIYSEAYFGIDGVVGLDFKFRGAPINMSLDWQPSFSFGPNGSTGFEGGWGGLAIRYAW